MHGLETMAKLEREHAQRKSKPLPIRVFRDVQEGKYTVALPDGKLLYINPDGAKYNPNGLAVEDIDWSPFYTELKVEKF